MRIALGYQSRVGKDTFADYLESKAPVIKIRFAESIYAITEKIQCELNLEIKKDPALLQLIGTILPEYYGRDIWMEKETKKIKEIIAHFPQVSIIVIDMRTQAQFDALKALGFTTVKITRKGRDIDRNVEHISEIALRDASFDYEITNDKKKVNFYRKIDKLLAFL